MVLPLTEPVNMGGGDQVLEGKVHSSVWRMFERDTCETLRRDVTLVVGCLIVECNPLSKPSSPAEGSEKSWGALLLPPMSWLKRSLEDMCVSQGKKKENRFKHVKRQAQIRNWYWWERYRMESLVLKLDYHYLFLKSHHWSIG